MLETSCDWIYDSVPDVDQTLLAQARQHQASLTKPPGSLGMLETVAEQFCAWQHTLLPSLNRIQVALFAADHGVNVHGVSAYPSIVTAQMVNNFASGGAAISVLSDINGAELSVYNVGTQYPCLPHPNVIECSIANGTADITQHPAMTEEQLARALIVGRDAVGQAEIFIGGEMGIGNTTSASAIYAA